VTRTEILMTMHEREPRCLFYTMQLGGNMRQLSKMEAAGLIRSYSRHGRGRQRDWYLTEEQHEALSFLFAEEPLSSAMQSPDASSTAR
jgi:DNA-binding PadR family transcriptional regulator